MPRIVNYIEYEELKGKGTEESIMHQHTYLCDLDGSFIVDIDHNCEDCKKDLTLLQKGKGDDEK